ncbi:hypothetical protein Asulf_01234 [Archaeoglobus sulfaticallidus PM70-1]|uniref:Uncharacterized protein n=1 Tax=Archaeoglobus sulfaticallidus PM70-1 TaxID=387631 RepID=N0BLU9_9EURY|nr:hypothetical protein Asulf_01234 [Archaeoglobus sulfaticallidus PM70-1]
MHLTVKSLSFLQLSVKKIMKVFEDVEDLIHYYNIWWADFSNYSQSDVVKIMDDMISGQLENLERYGLKC